MITIKKSKSDMREYKGGILENKIKCLFKKATNILSCKFNLDFVTFIEKNAM